MVVAALGDVIFAFGTIDGLVIALFANNADVKFGAVAGAAIVVPGPGVTDVAPGIPTLVGSIRLLGARFGWRLAQKGCQQEKRLFETVK